MHIHVEKGEKKCKYWLDSENFKVEEVFIRKMNAKDKRQVVRIIIDNFEYIEKEWTKFQRRKRNG